MLLICLMFLLSVLSIVMAVIFYKNNKETAHFLAVCVSIIVVITFGVLSIRAITVNINKDGDRARKQMQYEDLYSQAYNHLYEHDDYAKKDLANQIMNWNSELEEYKAFHKNPWVWIFYPIDVDQFKTIPITLLGRTVG